MCIRDSDKGLEKANLWNDKRYVFVWYNNENQPRGLMITHKIEEDGVTYLDCTHKMCIRDRLNAEISDAELKKAIEDKGYEVVG